MSEQDDVLSLLRGEDGCGQTRAARADHNDVAAELNVGLFDRGGVGDRALEYGRIESAALKGVEHRGLDRVGGDGRAGDGVDQQTLVFVDRHRELFDGDGADALGLLMVQDADLINAFGVRDDLDLDRAVSALGGAGQRQRIVGDVGSADGLRLVLCDEIDHQQHQQDQTAGDADDIMQPLFFCFLSIITLQRLECEIGVLRIQQS